MANARGVAPAAVVPLGARSDGSHRREELHDPHHPEVAALTATADGGHCRVLRGVRGGPAGDARPLGGGGPGAPPAAGAVGDQRFPSPLLAAAAPFAVPPLGAAVALALAGRRRWIAAVPG